MRILGLLVSALLALSVAGCGEDEPQAKAPRDRSAVTAPPTDENQDAAGTDEGAAASTLADAEMIAVRLEQIFAGSSYPKELAGAIKVARVSGLEPSDGNTIAGYEYDAEDVEFKLCVENTSGAFAIYDTRPMSMRASGDSGGCP